MAMFKVPSDFTLQEAVVAAAASNDAENFIDIHASPIFTTAQVEISDDFNLDRKLTIRPDPAIPGLNRAVIASTYSSDPIFRAEWTGYVTFQDLDIVRYITNNDNLVELWDCNNITIERCRIGSIWPTTGTEGWSNLYLKSPINVVARNNIFFAYRPNTFDYGIRIIFDSARGCSLLLYNNVVADYEEYGIHATSPPISDAFLLLRNNVVLNHPSADPEPFAYYSEIFDMTVETSHNAAFAAVGQVETIVAGAQSISEEAGANFLRRARAQVDGAFVEHTWVIDPEWAPNADFFRLVNRGPLHNEPTDAGQNVRNGEPHGRDVEVLDDIENDGRPSGIPLHTDRGADQIRDDDLLINLDSFTLTPPLLPGCKVCIGEVTLNGLAPDGGAKIKLTTTNTAATVPATVTISAGATSKTFKITTAAVTNVKTGTVKATYRGVSKSRSLTIRPIGVQLLKLSLSAVVGGNDVTGAVDLECKAAPGEIKVTLKSDNGVAVVPNSLTILAGALSGTFTMKTRRVSVTTSVTITATANGISKSATLKIKSH